MTILNRIKSNWSFQERENLNNNWGIIENYLSNLQGQINILTGDVNVQELIDQLNSIFNQSHIILEDLEKAINDVTTVITNAQSATSEANNAAQEAIDAISDIQSIIDNFGSKGVYDNSKTYSKNNIVYDDGCSYIYTNAVPGSGNAPPTYPTISNAYWHRLADKGASGNGSVSKVNGKGPNGTGEITLAPNDIGAASNDNLTGLQKTVNEHLAESSQIAIFSRNTALSILHEESRPIPYTHVSKTTKADFCEIDAVTNKIKLKKGIYLVSSVAIFASNGTGMRNLEFEESYSRGLAASQVLPSVQSLAHVIKVDTDDYLPHHIVMQTSGEPLNLTSIKTTVYKLGDV